MDRERRFSKEEHPSLLRNSIYTVKQTFSGREQAASHESPKPRASQVILPGAGNFAVVDI